MRQLRSCDFCDAADGLGVYEVGPDDASAESRRLVLCPDCRERLDWVLEPFYDARADDPEPGPEPEDVTLLGVSDSRSHPAPDESGRSGAESGSDDAADADAESPAPGGAPAAEVPPDDEAAADSGAEDDPPTARPAGASTAERAAADTPPKYRQVMRFLGNRDLPIDRTEAETLASGAYDLDAGEASDIIDAALERGLLREEGGQLRPA